MQLTLSVTIISTKINGMHVCSMHFLSSSELLVSMQPIKVSIEANRISVKKNRWHRMPIEFLCHTIMPSFFT